MKLVHDADRDDALNGQVAGDHYLSLPWRRWNLLRPGALVFAWATW